MSSCCTPDGSCQSGATDKPAADSTTTTVYNVSGMTCGHCKGAVTEAVGALDDVRAVDVDLEAARITVITGGAPDDALIAKAVDDVGYEVTGRVAGA
jgi:copper chaperone CopZ